MRMNSLYNTVADDTLFTQMNVGSDGLQHCRSGDAVSNSLFGQFSYEAR